MTQRRSSEPGGNGFTSNHPDQLEEYYQLVENKFKRVKIREYVYLTLNGIKPIQYDKDISKNKLYKYKVNMSWNKDILNIITKFTHFSLENIFTLWWQTFKKFGI